MNPFASLGHAIMHLLVVLAVFAVMIVGGVCLVRWTMGQHDTAVVQGVTIKAGADARYADTQVATDAGATRAADVAHGARAQRTVDEKAREADAGKPVDLNADDIRSIWGEPAHAQP